MAEVFYFDLPCDEWEETHKAGAFDGLRELTLMLCADTGTFAGDHACMGVQVIFPDLGILVIDQLYVVR